MRVNDALATWVFATLVAIELATLLRPREAARSTRWLSAAAVALLVACVVPWLGAIPTRFDVPVDRIPHAMEARRVDRPTASELASLRGSSRPVSSGAARQYRAHDSSYGRVRLPHDLALRAGMLVGASVGLASLAMIWLWRARRRFALSTTATLVAAPYRAATVVTAIDAGEQRHRVWLGALIVVAGGLFAASVECAGRVSGVWR